MAINASGGCRFRGLGLPHFKSTYRKAYDIGRYFQIRNLGSILSEWAVLFGLHCSSILV